MHQKTRKAINATRIRFYTIGAINMFDDNLLYDLNLRYLSLIKELAIQDPKLASRKFGLSEFLIKIISNNSFQQLERIAKQDDIYFNFLPDEKLFARLVQKPDSDLMRISVAVSANLSVKTANE
ncbi:hypothetical protein SOPP22_01665 [Shewanella sp. OPT22]|nr:hypothetical protein SOPP22_01665 [Shewanella sp. OPT22]